MYNFQSTYISSTPATLPLETDVLILTEYQSEHLFPYRQVVEVAHRGNLIWNEIFVRPFAGHAGYNILSPLMQRQFCESVVNQLREVEKRRFLVKIFGHWSELPHHESRIHYCHKAMIAGALPMDPTSDPISRTAVLTRTIDELITDAKFGTYRDTRIYQVEIQQLLHNLESKILRLTAQRRAISKPGLKPNASNEKHTYGLRQPLATYIPNRKSAFAIVMPNRVNTLKRQTPAVNNPFFNVGDIVEGRYGSTDGKVFVSFFDV
jgi:hypothetical protein